MHVNQHPNPDLQWLLLDFTLTETNGFISKPSFTEKLKNIVSINRHREAFCPLTEDTTATRIQTAFRGFKARKFYCNSK
ncbi:putative IQ motif, EF-hand binding protein [Helianthus anomalus]